MLAEQEAGAKYWQGKGPHQQSNYMTIHAGITFAPGDHRAHLLRLTNRESKLVYGNDRKWKLKSDLRNFAQSEFLLVFVSVD